MILVVFLTLPRLVNVASTCHVLRSNSPHTLVSFYKALLLQAQRTRMDNDKALTQQPFVCLYLELFDIQALCVGGIFL